MQNDKAFYDGFLEGIEYARQITPSRLPAAHNIACQTKEADERRRASALAAANLSKYAKISDADSAATVYNAVITGEADTPFELILGAVYFAGKIDGKRIERARRVK